MKNFTYVSAYLTILCVVIVASFTMRFKESNAHANPANEIRFLSAGINSSMQKLHCAQAKVVFEENTPREWAIFHNFMSADYPKAFKYDTKKDSHKSLISSWLLNGTDLDIAINDNSNDVTENLISRRLVSSSGVVKSLYKYGHKNGDNKLIPETIRFNGNISSSETVLTQSLWTGLSYMDPRMYAYFPFVGGEPGMPLDQVLLDPKYDASFEGSEDIDGSSCMKVKLSLQEKTYVLFWIDVDHSFIIRKREEYIMTNGDMALKSSTNVSSVVKSGDAYLPGVIKTQNYRNIAMITDVADTKPPQGYFPKGLSEKSFIVHDRYVTLSMPATQNVTISDFDADCAFPVGAFEMHWPLGTDVNDTINQQRLLVTAISPEEKRAVDERRQKMKQPILKASPASVDELNTLNSQRKIVGKSALKDAFVVALAEHDADFLQDIINKADRTKGKITPR